MADRTAPYPSYNYIVDIGGRDPQKPLGGFSDVSGLQRKSTSRNTGTATRRSLTFEKYPERTKSAT